MPDITNVQVQINTDAPGYSPLEAEQRITFPVENGDGRPAAVSSTRARSRATACRRSRSSSRTARTSTLGAQLINERIQEVKSKLPPGIEPTMGPITTGLGEIYMLTVEAEAGARSTTDGKPYTPTDLRTIQDWIIKPQLRNVPGVIEVNTIGGFEKQYHVTPASREAARLRI